MDAVMWAALLGVAGVAAGAALGSFAVWVAEVLPARKRERALRDSIDDLGWLMGETRKARRSHDAVMRMALDVWITKTEVLRAERDQARVAAALALTYYGKEAERADALQLAGGASS